MEPAPPALILASRRRALTGNSRGLSRAYNKGDLVRVRTGVYYNKPAWLALKAWERYAATVAAVTIVDAALGSRRKEGEGLTRVDVQQAAAGLASAAKRRRVLEVLELADPAAESVGESRSRALIHVLGLPAPILQHSVYDHQGFIARTDFFWPDYGIIGEFDGDAKYLDDELLGDRSTRAIILAEKKREDRLRALGYTVVRWDWKAMTDPPRVTGGMVHVRGINPRSEG